MWNPHMNLSPASLLQVIDWLVDVPEEFIDGDIITLTGNQKTDEEHIRAIAHRIQLRIDGIAIDKQKKRVITEEQTTYHQ